jgi:hypothetical protein
MSFSLRALRPLGLIGVGVLSTFGALSLTHLGPVQAQSPGVNLATLVASVNTLKSQLASDEATIALLQGTPVPGPKGDKGDTGAQGVKGDTSTPGVNGKDGINGLQGVKGDTGPAGAGFTSDKIALLNTMSLSKGIGSNTELTFTGVNVHIVSGSGSEYDDTFSSSGTPIPGKSFLGLGNLIIGYNPLGSNNGDVRTGSHNLIVGEGNSYSSYGGIVGGNQNTISGPDDSILSGQLNIASGSFTSVSGGAGNTASGAGASVSGGARNTASGFAASVSGGAGNHQSNTYGWTGGSYHSP